MKKNLPVLSVVLYVLSLLLAIYTVFSFITCFRQVSDAVAAGQLSYLNNLFDIINFYMQNCATYLLFGVITLALGRILHRTGPVFLDPDYANYSPEDESEQDKNLDEWFGGNDANADDSNGK